MERQPAVRPAKKGESVKNVLGKWDRTWEKPMAELNVGSSELWRQKCERVGLYLDDNGRKVACVMFDGSREFRHQFYLQEGWSGKESPHSWVVDELKTRPGFRSLDQALALIRVELAEALQERERILSEYVSPEPVGFEEEVVEPQIPEEEEEKVVGVSGFISRVRASIPSLW